MNDQPFFIIGTKRGGTTLLRLMLNTHSELAIPPESHFLIPLLEQYKKEYIIDEVDLSNILTLISRHPRLKYWSITGEQIMDLKSKVHLPLALGDLIDQVFRLEIENTGKVRWGEKTPEYVDIGQDLAVLFPSAFFIILTRDGRDVSISLKERGWEGWSTYQRARYWASSIRKMYAFKTNKNAHFIQYEQLVLNPEFCLNQICRFLNVTYEGEMKNFNLYSHSYITPLEKAKGIHRKLTRKPRADDINRWKIQSSKFEVWAFESVAHKELSAAGYKVLYFNPSNFLHLCARALYLIFATGVSLLEKSFHQIISVETRDRIKNRWFYKYIRRVIKSK